jgi:hypothetical protein
MSFPDQPRGSRFLRSPNRREFARRLGSIIATVAAGVVPFAVWPKAVLAAIQNNWRNCQKCRTLFFNGYRRGRCPASGPHVGDNRNYKLTYDLTGPGQSAWRFCNKCDGLFFDGYSHKGVCPSGGGHVAQGFNFSLRYDSRAPGEPGWRYCNKCKSIFHDTGPNKGVCPAGEGHVAEGYQFVLDDTVRI